MSEDNPTADLTNGEILERMAADVRMLVADMREVKERLGALESAAEDRARETRPKLDLIIKAVSDTREEMIDIKEQMRLLAGRELELSSVYSRLSSRVTALEDRARDGERRTN